MRARWDAPRQVPSETVPRGIPRRAKGARRDSDTSATRSPDGRGAGPALFSARGLGVRREKGVSHGESSRDTDQRQGGAVTWPWCRACGRSTGWEEPPRFRPSGVPRTARAFHVQQARCMGPGGALEGLNASQPGERQSDDRGCPVCLWAIAVISRLGLPWLRHSGIARPWGVPRGTGGVLTRGRGSWGDTTRVPGEVRGSARAPGLPGARPYLGHLELCMQRPRGSACRWAFAFHAGQARCPDAAEDAEAAPFAFRGRREPKPEPPVHAG